MKEIADIIKAYEQAIITGRRMALATVVHVDGSSYRRPGARMLVTDDGQLTGAISGGCLEGDALRKALLAISQQKNKLVTYDTTDESDPILGAQLGCNGIVHILFEPIQANRSDNPVALLKKSLEQRIDAVLVTLFSLKGRNAMQHGTCLLKTSELTTVSNDLTSNYQTLDAVAEEGMLARDSIFRQVMLKETEVTAFVEYLSPPINLIVVGAGNDTIPLTEMASILGWRITVADGRAGHVTRARFPKAHQLVPSKASEVLPQIEVDTRTFVLLLTHNYHYDLEVLSQLIFTDCAYIGALGPKKKLERMYDDLAARGIVVTESQKSRIYGPVGLEIGAETSEEIALSILSEIKSVINGRHGGFLREKSEPIHQRRMEVIPRDPAIGSPVICAVGADLAS